MLRISIRNLLRHKLRNALTVIGIAVGIGLVIALGSIGSGLTKSMESAFEGSADIVSVSSTGQDGISGEMLEEISYIDGVERVIPVGSYISSMEGGGGFMGISVGVQFTAINPEDQDYMIGPEIFMDRGRKLEEEDSGKFVALVGYKFAENRNLDVGDEIDYGNDTLFEIIGVIEETGGDTDNLVLVPLETMQELEEDENIRTVLVKAEDAEVSENIAEDINTEMDDVIAISYKALVRQISDALGTINLAVMGIGAVSAIVAGLMITVVMIMSVTERRREIGIMKALGATEGMILKQVLQESGIIGLIGGLLGVAVGWLGAFLMNFLLDFPATVTPWLIFIGMAFALILGMGAGLYPAWNASRLDPIEVLRYE
jgi:putative ABC transport system permease protein